MAILKDLGVGSAVGSAMNAPKGELMKYKRRSEKLDRFLKKRVKITYKDGKEMKGILMWSNSILKMHSGADSVIRAGHYYLLTKRGSFEIYKCSVKSIEEDFERA